MYQNIGQGNALGFGNIGGFNNSLDQYWSSSEDVTSGGGVVFRKNFYDGNQNFYIKTAPENVRAIREF